MSERDRIDPDFGRLPPAPPPTPGMAASQRAERGRHAREEALGCLSALAQPLVALAAGAIAGSHADPAVGAIVGMSGMLIGVIAGYLVSNFVLMLVAPFALAPLAKRLLVKNPERLPPHDPTEGMWAYRLGVFMVNATVFIAAGACAAIISMASEAATFGRTFGVFAIAALVVALLTSRARGAIV